jgi:hypothetical protein
MLLYLRSLFEAGQYTGVTNAVSTVSGTYSFEAAGLPSGTLWRPFYATPLFAGAVRARFRSEGEIGIPGPALPGLTRLNPTFRQTEERFPVSVYGYVGRIDALAAIAALWSFTANPIELVTATSGIAATVKVTWNPAELIAATSTLAATYVFQAGGPATYAYAGPIAGHSTITTTVVGPPSVSRGPVPMRRVRPRVDARRAAGHVHLRQPDRGPAGASGRGVPRDLQSTHPGGAGRGARRVVGGGALPGPRRGDRGPRRRGIVGTLAPMMSPSPRQAMAGPIEGGILTPGALPVSDDNLRPRCPCYGFREGS